MVPKFRAWDKDSKVMRSWKDLILTKDDGNDFWLIGYKENSCITSFDHDQILMQSTGMKDRKGVEIFEGDVVWIIDEGELDNGWGWSEEVIFHNGSFMAGDDNLLANVNHRCVVSGNKYEQKELLEPAYEN